MRLSAAISFPFRGPNAWANLGCALVCMLIPLVGPIVLLGYVIQMETALVQNLQVDAPRFDFGKFSKYLVRGVQVFAGNLVLMLLYIPIHLMVVGLFVLLGVLLLDKHQAAAVACFVLAGVMHVGGLLAINVFLMPLTFKAGLEDRFQSIFDFRFALDCFRRIGWIAIGYNLLLFLMVVPFLVFACIPLLGIFVIWSAVIVMTFISVHLRCQLYLLYLDRGGTPINIKYEPPEPAFPVMVNPPPMPPQMPDSP